MRAHRRGAITVTGISETLRYMDRWGIDASNHRPAMLN